MPYFSSIIFGIVQGLTEFLPVSSTAHLILVSSLLKIAQTDFQKMFEVVIQLGSILAVIILFWPKLKSWQLLKKLIVAFIPTGVIGLLFHNVIKEVYNHNAIILSVLFAGGLVIILFDRFFQNDNDDEQNMADISYKQALALGLFQSVAIIPGVSRSAATILGGLALGFNRRAVVEFSFLLAVPTMLAASGFELLTGYQSLGGGNLWLLITGFVFAFLTAWLSIKVFLSFVRSHRFTIFGLYRMVIAVFLFFFLLW